MQPMYYIGLDVHKRKISYCVKEGSGRIHAEGSISATRLELDHWMRSLPQPWSAAMEATMFTGWIYDHLKPHAFVLTVAHPLMLRAIAHIRTFSRFSENREQAHRALTEYLEFRLLAAKS
jgi:transposase